MNKKHVKDFITHYLDLFPLKSDIVMTPKNGLLTPLLAETFKHLPVRYWYGVVDGPKGPHGLLQVSVFDGRFSNPNIVFSGESSTKEVASLHFWWANEKLKIIPEYSILDDIWTMKRKEAVNITGMNLKDLAEFIITRIVANTLEGKWDLPPPF